MALASLWPGIVSLAARAVRGSLRGMTISSNPYRGFRFPREVIEHAVWLALSRKPGREPAAYRIGAMSRKRGERERRIG